MLVGDPNASNPFLDATEVEVTGRDHGRIALAAGYGSHGQTVRRTRNRAGAVTEIWLGGARLKREKDMIAEMERLYAPRKRRPAG